METEHNGLKIHVQNCIKEFIEKEVKIKDQKFMNELEWKLKGIDVVSFRNIDIMMEKKKYTSSNKTTLDLSTESDELTSDVELDGKSSTRIQIDGHSDIKKFYLQKDYDSSSMIKRHIFNIIEDNYDIKFSYSTETNIPNYDISNLNNKKVYMRLKNRKSFEILDKNIRIDLTIVKSVSVEKFNVSNISKYTDFGKETYEVEVEILSPNELKIHGVHEELFNDLMFLLSSKSTIPYVLNKTISNTICSNFKDELKLKTNKLPKVKTFLYNDIDKIKSRDEKINKIKEMVDKHPDETNRKYEKYYFIMDKTDGIHSFLYYINKKLYLINQDLTEARYIGTITGEYNKFILEGELDIKEDSDSKTLDFHIFDMPLVGTHTPNMYCYDFDTRINTVNTSINFTVDSQYPFNVIKKIYDTIQVNDKKEFIYPDPEEESSDKTSDSISKNNKGHILELLKDESKINEGLIFIENEPYFTQNILKWKKKTKLSIDFLVKEQETINTAYKVYDLYVYKSFNRKNTLVPFKIKGIPQTTLINSEKLDLLSTDLSKGIFTNLEEKKLINNCVYEFIYNTENKLWIPIRFRDDKTKTGLPNAELTALSTYQTIINPLMLSNINGSNKYYTARYNDDELSKHYLNLASFNKEKIKIPLYLSAFNAFENMKNDVSLFEIGYGQGGDVFRLSKVLNTYKQIKNIVVDGIDTEGDTIIRDKYSRNVRNVGNVGNVGKHDMDRIKLGNLKKGKFDSLSMGDKKYNIISAQFSIHYVLGDFDKSIENLISYINDHLTENGVFFGTTLDSDKVDDLFDEQETPSCLIVDDNSIKTMVNDKIAWQIKNDSKTHDYDVIIPSNNITDTFFSEYKVSRSKLEEIVSKQFKGQLEIETKSFSEYDNTKYNLIPELALYASLNFSFFIRKL